MEDWIREGLQTQVETMLAALADSAATLPDTDLNELAWALNELCAEYGAPTR